MYVSNIKHVYLIIVVHACVRMYMILNMYCSNSNNNNKEKKLIIIIEV